MAFHDLDRYIVRIHTSSYPTLKALFAGQPSIGTTHGPRGRSFSAPARITVIDPYHLQIGAHTVRTDVYTLPSAPLTAVVDASPYYSQYRDLDPLFQALSDPDTGIEAFRAWLADVVGGGLQADQPAQLVNSGSGFVARWLPAQTRFIRTAQGHWFASLAFELHPTPDLQTSVDRRTTFGLDLGSSPMVCAAGGDGRVLAFGGQKIALLDGLRRFGGFSAKEKLVLRTLTHAIGRRDGEEAILYLAQHGRTVYSEHLTLEGMWEGFVASGRLQATFDVHFAWLPQALYRAGVPFKRVDPMWTSQLCHIHPHTIGKRLGKEFFCPECDDCQHSDVNAAHNVHDRGLHLHGVSPLRRTRPMRRAS